MTATDSKGEMRRSEPLSRHTSRRVVGPARRLYRPADRDDLVRFLRGLDPDEPLLWIGLLAGIRGTMGGALAMNAGAFGGETWERVVRITTIDRHGEVRVRVPEDYRIGYRQVEGPAGEWFLDAELGLRPGDGEAAMARIRELPDRRGRTQPIGLPSCGSVFRNPHGDHAARLIEAAGLKGQPVGGAQVSEKHANFIINTGDASAADIAALIDRVQRAVEHHSGVRLVPEVRRFWGEQQ